ncbi:hypothetical protein DPMN_072850 [Dreissena polymorpha]|uniref:G-protein coupled receptors family 1 profile domain-containing protein n=1 Tax=Dreissena polymorpha TaxID=45954 RepID=A0A9D4HCB7_DREPO|nr:hypothetical protein DPMN_072850 [Dreissena polymorpha]
MFSLCLSFPETRLIHVFRDSEGVAGRLHGECDPGGAEQYLGGAAIIFLAILMVVGVFGNILIVYVFTFKNSPSTYRSFILWLGWKDLIACTVGMPLLIASLLHPYMFPSEAACKTLRFLHVFFVVASAFIVIGIAIERHRRIFYPLSAKITPIKINIICFVSCAL